MPKKLHPDGTPIERYAFIDVYNTINTTNHVLNFDIDWDKLYRYLMDKWCCKRVYFYAGIELGDDKTEIEYERLASIGYEMRTKRMMVYKRAPKVREVTCPKCGDKHIEKIDMGYQRKSNCDVEMTMDIMLQAEKNVDLLIFTGDGDFSKLIEYVTTKKLSKVKLVSHTRKGDPRHLKRFSTSLQGLLKSDDIDYVPIKDWENIIKK